MESYTPIRTEAREWLKDPNHKIPWYRDDPYWQEEVEKDPHYCPAEDIDIVDGFYQAGAELVEIVTFAGETNESASFEITLPPQNGELVEIILNLFVSILES